MIYTMIIYYYHYILLVITIVIINIMISIVILRPMMISKENSNCVRTRMRRFLKFIRQHTHGSFVDVKTSFYVLKRKLI